MALYEPTNTPVLADFFLSTNFTVNLGQILFFKARNNRRKKNQNARDGHLLSRFQNVRDKNGVHEDEPNYNSSRYNSSSIIGDYEDDEDIEQEEQRAFSVRSEEKSSEDSDDLPKGINIK